jgi:hypothetical protein
MTGFPGGGRGLWVKILTKLQAEEGIAFKEVTIDGATMKVRRREGGQKASRRQNGGAARGQASGFARRRRAKGSLWRDC